MRAPGFYSVLAITLLLLPACASFGPAPGPGATGAGAESASAPAAAVGGHEAGGAVVAQPTGAAAYLSAEAEGYQAAQNYTAAAASLERAMRIEPGNPWLSLALARLRLVEGQSHQAEMLARRALSRAAQDRNLTAQCWELVARARRVEGDASGALEAARMADQHR